jgi:hypothetical protein
MEQLLAFCDWERQKNPGSRHVAEWAAGEIERQAVLINSLAVDAMGEPRLRYVCATIDGRRCVMEPPSDGDGGSDVGGVYLSKREFDKPKDFDE